MNRTVSTLAVVLVAVLGMALRVRAQDHAPTVERCRVALTAWDGEMSGYWGAENVKQNSGLPNKSQVSSLSATELLDRSALMEQCASVDNPNGPAYAGLEALYREILGDRAQSFISRHKLNRSFFREDSQGLR